MDRTDLIYRYPGLPFFLNAVIAILLIIITLFFIRDILSLSSRRTERPAPPVHAGTQEAKKGLQEYAGIFKSNPFGFPGGELKELAVTREGSVSHSDITLVGTIAGPPVYSYAIFADKAGRQEVFRIGESVFGAGKLKRVEKDRAVITESGREIRIPLAEVLTIKEVGPYEAGAGGSGFARSAGSGLFILDQKRILHALENPNQLMTDARLQPNLVNGKQEGFILREVKSGGIYQSLGLQNGDVLLRINEYNISNPENALQAFTALRGMDRVQVDLLRGGSRMTMTYQIR